MKKILVLSINFLLLQSIAQAMEKPDQTSAIQNDESKSVEDGIDHSALLFSLKTSLKNSRQRSAQEFNSQQPKKGHNKAKSMALSQSFMTAAAQPTPTQPTPVRMPPPLSSTQTARKHDSAANSNANSAASSASNPMFDSPVKTTATNSPFKSQQLSPSTEAELERIRAQGKHRKETNIANGTIVPGIATPTKPSNSAQAVSPLKTPPPMVKKKNALIGTPTSPNPDGSIDYSGFNHNSIPSSPETETPVHSPTKDTTKKENSSSPNKSASAAADSQSE